MESLSLECLRGLRPFEAKLFAEIDLPDVVLAQLDECNRHAGKKGMPVDTVKRCIFRMLCAPTEFAWLSLSNSNIDYKTVCFSFRSADRVFLGLGNASGSKVTPGKVWPSLRPFGTGRPETLERKFNAWAQERNIPELTNSIHVTATEDHLPFLDQIKQEADRDAALLIFADWLEDQSDPRAEMIRAFASVDR